ncbi:MAG TPA: carbon-nitrogen hydrolase family protein [Xanthomonadales bacterium]|nr:carbon-nitrogen hydrolase family protein [Xanthomonadales bacterium]
MTQIRAGFAQIAPAWLDGAATLEKVSDHVSQAADQSIQLLAFGEALVPGYPFWPELTGGAVFDSERQKEMFALYAREAVDISGGDLDQLRQICKQRNIAVYLGTIERAADRGGHSLYASLVYIDPHGDIGSVHRKLMPTYEERLTWSPGDGHGLRTHPLHGFTVGGLNCWENWMPLPRASLYAQGENLHVAAWPGSKRNTEDITRFIARESRSFVISASGLMNADWITDEVPGAREIRTAAHAGGRSWLAGGGSCIAGPDGQWIIEPQNEVETIMYAELDLEFVYRERQNFDPVGHYSRPDVTHLKVDRRRQSTASFRDD